MPARPCSCLKLPWRQRQPSLPLCVTPRPALRSTPQATGRSCYVMFPTHCNLRMADTSTVSVSVRLVKAALLTRHPPGGAPGLAGLLAGPLPPLADALRLPLASAACMSAATFSCVACSRTPQLLEQAQRPSSKQSHAAYYGCSLHRRSTV